MVDSKIAAMTVEGEITVGMTGGLEVKIPKDTRLGNVDHRAVADAIHSLPDAFDDAANSPIDKCLLKLGYPFLCLLVGVGIVGIIVFLVITVGFGSDVVVDALRPDLYMIIFGLMAVTVFVVMIGNNCAVKKGLEGVKERLRELNQTMYPLNFSMREEEVDPHRRGATTFGWARKDYFLGIRNLEMDFIMVGPGSGGPTECPPKWWTQESMTCGRPQV